MTKSSTKATHRVRNQVTHQASAVRAVACQLRKIETRTLALKTIAGELELIADKLDLEARQRSETLPRAGPG